MLCVWLEFLFDRLPVWDLIVGVVLVLILLGLLVGVGGLTCVLQLFVFGCLWHWLDCCGYFVCVCVVDCVL